MININEKIEDYIKDTIPNFQKRGILFNCPVCKEVKCNTTKNSNKIYCLHCKKHIGNIFDVVKILEPDKANLSQEEITQYLKKKYDLDYLTEQDINRVFDFYMSLGFDLVPVVFNDKIPIEKDWLNKEHKNKEEWLDWFNDNLNFGVKAGEKSGVTTLDFDTKDIPEDLKKVLNETLLNITERGTHYIYQYEPTLKTTRIDEIKLDILNGKQFVVFPSKVNGARRKELIGKTINKMSPELIKYLQDKKATISSTTFSEPIDEEIKLEELEEINFNLVGEGNRNNFLLRLGGILQKQLGRSQLENVLGIINRMCCKPPYPQREFENICKSLDKYGAKDERELALKILVYLRIVGDASARDVKEVVGETKEKVDKALAFLVKEGYAFKKRSSYHVLKRIQWKDTFFDEDKLLDFKVPYFYDVAIFRPGDMILIGGQQKVGKSHVALNIIKQLVEQKKKPYYLNLEAGNRFAKIAKQLGLKDTDFFNATHFSPESIELEDKAITIIDWLLPKDYAETDKLFQHFAEQLFRHGGLLFVFVQLRNSGDFFAKDMVAMFPAFVCRYLYDKNAQGEETPETGAFHVDYVREPKQNRKRFIIPCKYGFETRRLTRTDELDMPAENNTITETKSHTEGIIEVNAESEQFIKETLGG
uniref:Putative bifunctional DNA primase/polymerase n=1 Tax=viral metagenome TaxID=1070528 RepID=A0A6M3KVM6_9ZZZZ